MIGTIPDWISAGANVVLAVSVMIGAIVTLRRWPVVLHAKSYAGPYHTKSIIDGVEHPPAKGWLIELGLVSGDVAHVGSVTVERWRGWRWRGEPGVVDFNRALPRSLEKGDKVALHITTPKSDKAPIRIRVREYRSLRSVMLPFVDVKKD